MNQISSSYIQVDVTGNNRSYRNSVICVRQFKKHFGSWWIWKRILSTLFIVAIFYLFISSFHFAANFQSFIQKDITLSFEDDFEILTNQSDEIEPHLDRNSINEQEALQASIEKYRNLPRAPYIYGNQPNGPRFLSNFTCARFPPLQDLRFNNKYWQEFDTSDGTFELYGAYYDIRIPDNGTYLRILGMINRVQPKVKTHCQIWFSNQKEPLVSPVLDYKLIWVPSWGNNVSGVLQPYLITCEVPKNPYSLIPTSVSLVENVCDDAYNNLKVQFEKPENKSDFAICVKGLDFQYKDMSVRLIEWIELMEILGAKKIYMYELSSHPNVTKVLDYYVNRGLIDLTPLTLPGSQSNDPFIRHFYLGKKLTNKRQNELIPYNDCLNRNMYKYDYITLLDTDEVIMPLKRDNWAEMMKDINDKMDQKVLRPSYHFRNVYFFDDFVHEHSWYAGIPKYLHMLQHIHRAKNYTGPRSFIKSFHKPQEVLTVHNHFPLHCVKPGVTGCSFKSGAVDEHVDGYLQHYRSTCTAGVQNCDAQFHSESVKDTTIWKFKDELIRRTNLVLRTLGFLHFPTTPSTISVPTTEKSIGLNKT